MQEKATSVDVFSSPEYEELIKDKEDGSIKYQN